MSRMDRLVEQVEARYCAGPVARAALVRPGRAAWYALRVVPQREDQAEAWLGLRGIYAFHPVLTRRLRRRGRVREYHRRYLPGYVFARFPGEPVAHKVTDCPFITGALCRANGTWGVLQPRKLQAIHSMRKVDEAQEAARRADRARRRRAALVGVGEAAMFRGGPFAGFHCEVVDLPAEGGATVRFRLFGREVLAGAECGDLVPLRKGG